MHSNSVPFLDGCAFSLLHKPLLSYLNTSSLKPLSCVTHILLWSLKESYCPCHWWSLNHKLDWMFLQGWMCSFSPFLLSKWIATAMRTKTSLTPVALQSTWGTAVHSPINSQNQRVFSLVFWFPKCYFGQIIFSWSKTLTCYKSWLGILSNNSSKSLVHHSWPPAWIWMFWYDVSWSIWLHYYKWSNSNSVRMANCCGDSFYRLGMWSLGY